MNQLEKLIAKISLGMYLTLGPIGCDSKNPFANPVREYNGKTTYQIELVSEPSTQFPTEEHVAREFNNQGFPCDKATANDVMFAEPVCSLYSGPLPKATVRVKCDANTLT